MNLLCGLIGAVLGIIFAVVLGAEFGPLAWPILVLCIASMAQAAYVFLRDDARVVDHIEREPRSGWRER